MRPAVPLSPAEFSKHIESGNCLVLDIRNYEAFGGKHVPGSWHIDFRGNFSTFAGWVLPADKEILLVGSSADEAAEAAVLLRRVGLDRVTGYLEEGLFESWASFC